MVKINKKRILIWGTHLEALKVRYQLSKNIDFIGFVDNYAIESTVAKETIYKPVDVINDSYFFIIVATEKTYFEIKKQLLDSGKKEFEDFIYYKWINKKLVYLHGNCHMDILKKMLLSVDEFSKYYVIYPLTLIQDNKEGFIDNNILSNLDVFIHQDIRKENEFDYRLSDEYTKKYLNDTCFNITIPNLFGVGKAFFPQFQWNKRNKPLIKDSNGMFPHGDIFIDDCMQKSMEIDEIITLIKEGTPFSEEYIRDNFDSNMKKISERQKNWDIHICDFIKKKYKEEQLFFDQGHPTNVVMREIAIQTLKLLNIEGVPDCKEKMDIHEEFVYPCVSKALSLKWKQVEIRKSEYGKKIAGNMDIEEYIREYIWWCY